MLKNNKKLSLILLLIITLIIFLILITRFFLRINNNINGNNNAYDFFNKKITYDFGRGTAYEIDIPQIINDYDEIVIRNNHLLLHSDIKNIAISKDETIFENLPPKELLVAGSQKSYVILYENDDTKLYEVTSSFSYMSPNGAKSETNKSYELYKKENDCTLKIIGSNKDEILKISNLITPTNTTQTLEEQFYGITVLDERILDTSKITIDEIYNVDGFLDIKIKVDESLINARFPSKNDKTHLPLLKKIKNWKLITKKDNYKIYHSDSGTGTIQSDALKIIKDNKTYFIDLTIPDNSFEIEMLIQEIFNILK